MHSLNYLLYTCSPLCKHLSSYDDKMHHCAKKQIKQNKETNTQKNTTQDTFISLWASNLPRLWSITQVVVKAAALRRAGAHWGKKLTRGHVEPQQQDEEHFGQLLCIRNLPTCARFAPTEVNQTIFFSLSFTGMSSVRRCPTASLPHSDQTTMSPEIKKDRQGLAKRLAFVSSGCVLHPGIG